MDKQAESSSDSDSNSSTSWVFVSDATTVENNTNTFHLDCSREPIQELTEQDLLSASSDIESDTDGISVISESEVPIEESVPTISQSLVPNEIENSHEENQIFTPTNTSDSLCPKEVTLNPSENSLKWIFKLNNLVGVGLIVMAIFLTSYLSTRNNTDKNDSTIRREENKALLENYKDQLCEIENDLRSNIGKIVDMTLSCTYGQKPRNYIKDQEIKKCVENEYKAKSNVLTPADNYAKIIKAKETYKSMKQKYKQYIGKLDKDHKITSTERSNKEYFLKKDKHEKEKYKKNQTKNQCDRKHKADKCKSKKSVSNYNKKDEHYKNKKYKDKYIYKNNLNKYRDDNLLSSRDKNLKYKAEKNHTTKYKMNRLRNQLYTLKSKVNATGEWYTNLYKARNQIRKEEHASDWVFERAYIRSKKRNKAQWYFKWMDVRAQLRHKQNYRPYSS